MRYVVKNESDKTEKLKSGATYQELKTICTTKNKDLIDDGIYRDPYRTDDGRRSHVEDQLAISYKNKCAYCERICKADIEHYRPKKKVTEAPRHEGYYWLCYEWTNLLPSCVTCNRDGAKLNKFPILGTRIEKPPELLRNGELDLEKFKANVSPLKDEKPYLLHPEIDQPEEFFEFEVDDDTKGIRIKGTDNDSRGEETIEICLLNRLELRLDRQIHVIDDFVSAVSAIFRRFAENQPEVLIDRLEQAIERLVDNSHDDRFSHTLLRKYIVHNIDNFTKIVIPFLPESQKRVVLEVFHLVF